jgi:hypothetical protein
MLDTSPCLLFTATPEKPSEKPHPALSLALAMGLYDGIEKRLQSGKIAKAFRPK